MQVGQVAAGRGEVMFQTATPFFNCVVEPSAVTCEPTKLNADVACDVLLSVTS